MSPVVRRLPTTVRSDDRTEAAALPFGAEGVNSMLGLVIGVSGVLGFSTSALGPGSLMRLLENILRCLYEGHRVHGGSAKADLVMQMGAGGPA